MRIVSSDRVRLGDLPVDTVWREESGIDWKVASVQSDGIVKSVAAQWGGHGTRPTIDMNVNDMVFEVTNQ